MKNKSYLVTFFSWAQRNEGFRQFVVNCEKTKMVLDWIVEKEGTYGRFISCTEMSLEQLPGIIPIVDL